jgi:small-conductance mechanosensitive channel
MYTDKYLSIGCQVQVAYDANIELVNELLLKAAFNHDDVIKTGKQKPNVLFKSFGEHALIFQLWCLIRDANKKSSVQSDLNYMILKFFKEHDIEMSLPQQTLIIQKSEEK